MLDLFCGLGNFTLPLARRVREVVGVEGDAGLMRRARENAAHNGIANADFHAADLAQGSQRRTPWMRAGFDRLLLDPPRSGADVVLAQLPLKQFKRIVYVSCHPGSLARDAGYPGQRARLEAARGGRDGHVPAHRARGIDRDVRAVGLRILAVAERSGEVERAGRMFSAVHPSTSARAPTLRRTVQLAIRQSRSAMGIEIERKFLVTGDGWRAAAHEVVPMAQGYLNDLAAMDSGAMKASVRVRIAGRRGLPQPEVARARPHPAGIRLRRSRSTMRAACSR